MTVREEEVTEFAPSQAEEWPRAGAEWNDYPGQGSGCFITTTVGLSSLRRERINAKIKFDCWSKDFYQAV